MQKRQLVHFLHFLQGLGPKRLTACTAIVGATIAAPTLSLAAPNDISGEGWLVMALAIVTLALVTTVIGLYHTFVSLLHEAEMNRRRHMLDIEMSSGL